MIRRGSEYLARVIDVVDSITHARDRGIEIELPAIGFRIRRVLHTHREIAQGQIRFVVRALHLFAYSVGSNVILLFEHKAADFCQMPLGIRIVPLMRAARPKRIFIEMDPFRLHAAEDHCAQMPVADRKSVAPLSRSRVVPEQQVTVLLPRGAARGGRHGNAGYKFPSGHGHIMRKR